MCESIFRLSGPRSLLLVGFPGLAGLLPKWGMANFPLLSEALLSKIALPNPRLS
jgi:hypothetical protein